MRELKFRVWDKVLSLWEKRHCVLSVDGRLQIYNPETGNYFQPNSEDYEIVWFTGLKDKNGVEIYEGDIVKILWPSSMTELYVVKWVHRGRAHLGGWEFSNPKDPQTYAGSCDNHTEVIGNAFDNPELLKEQ